MAESKTNQRVLITGGTGYIGFRLLSELRYNHMASFTPLALARATSDTVRLERLLDYPSVVPSVLIADLMDVDSLRAAVRAAAADIVVHLAGDMDFFPRDPARMLRVNVDGTRNLLQACADESASVGKKIRFVYISSTEAIGESAEKDAADENTPLNPDSDYGHSKVLCERVIADDFRDKLDTVVLRPSGVFGPGEDFFFREVVEMVAAGLTVVAPSPMTGRIVFTHVEDVVSGIILALAHPVAVGNVYNLCADESVSYRNMLLMLSDTLGSPRPVAYLNVDIGAFLMKLVGPLLNRGKRRTFMYQEKSVRDTVTNRVYSNKKMREELGFEPKYGLLAGMEQTVLHELAVGRVKKQILPWALKVCIHGVALAFFTGMNLFRGIRQRR